MKILSEGAPKYLLIDDERVERNAERAKPGDPVVVVVEETADGTTRHVGYGLIAEGLVTLAYAQRDSVTLDGRKKIRTAYMTYGRVALATERGEEASFGDEMEEAAPAPKTPKTKKTT